MEGIRGKSKKRDGKGKGKKNIFRIRNGIFKRVGFREGFIDFWEGFQKREWNGGKERKEDK